MQDIRLAAETPGPEEYCALRIAAGLSPRSVAAATRGLPATLFAVCARDGERLVGMGRVIGDGGLNYDIVDMAVDPDYQRRGIGYRIMELLMRYIHGHAPDSAYVSLLADDGAPALYGKFGFEFTAPKTVGMALSIRKQD
jgi:ribosomal protein S18 acetylase RimI-like enzyme